MRAAYMTQHDAWLRAHSCSAAHARRLTLYINRAVQSMSDKSDPMLCSQHCPILHSGHGGCGVFIILATAVQLASLIIARETAHGLFL